jgi:hypothetical protein
MADERDHEIEDLKRQLRWARVDNERVWRLLDDALNCLREANQRNNELRQERVAAAHERVVEAERRLACATLAARAPDVKLN